MAQLIQLRQRMKAIETTKKITHAMRLIAMSSHSRLKHKQGPLHEFRQHLTRLMGTLKNQLTQEVPHSAVLPPSSATKELVILVGSQKGLCGHFNNTLFQFFKKYQMTTQLPMDLVIVGHKTAQYVLHDRSLSIIYSQLVFGIKDLSSITDNIMSYLRNNEVYKSVIVISNKPKTFFIQRPTITTILPFTLPHIEKTAALHEEYMVEPSSSEIANTIIELYLSTEIRSTLYESLLAEQAARFISMDQATRNAGKLLEATTLAYNKLRQAKITQELTELASSY